MDQQEAMTLIAELTPGSLWIHRNGGEYEVIVLANLEFSDRYPLTVVYRTHTTADARPRIWARKASDWHRSMKPKVKTP